MNTALSDAKDVLAEIESVKSGIKESINFTASAPYLVIWGSVLVIWFGILQYAVFNQSLNPMLWYIWAVLGSGGVACSIYTGKTGFCANVVSGQATRRENANYFKSWIVMAVFAALWVMLFWPMTPERLGVFVFSVCMFGYVLDGIWSNDRRMLALGLWCSVASFGGFFLHLHVYEKYLYGWLALSCGMPIFLSGLISVLKARSGK